MPRKKSPNGTGRVGRDKKRKAIEGEKYKGALEEIVKRNITPEQIEIIYNRCQERKQTQISRDTLAIKLANLLKYFESRNEGINENSSGYISSNDAIEMILKNPRIMSSNLDNNIIMKCNVITNKNSNDIEKANFKIKHNPGIFRKTVEAIKEGR